MNASINDTMATTRAAGHPKHSSSASYDKTRHDVGSMDDLQFNASLDALLDSENLDETTGSGSYQSPSMEPVTVGLGNSFAASHPSHGLLTTSGVLGTSSNGMLFSLPNAPYAVTPSNQSSLVPGMTSFVTTAFPSMQGSVTSCTTPLALQQHPPLMPSPPTAAHPTTVASAPPSSSSRKVATKSAGVSMAEKRFRDATAVSEDEEDRGKRRHDRNMREQQRSHKITEQIDQLRDVLAESNIPFKPDKFSTLVTVSDFIKQLQAKSAHLDTEHKKLLDTIARTNELVKDQYLPASTNGENPPGYGRNIAGGADQATSSDDADAACVPNVDYRSVFTLCGVPLALLSIDGRFLDCNKEFETLTGYEREELLPCEKLTLIADETPSSSDGASTVGSQAHPTSTRNLSLFNLLSREHMEGVFLAMSVMLKHPPEKVSSRTHTSKKDYWTGFAYLSREPETKMRMNVTLVRSPQGRAKFFDCSLTPTTDD